MKTCSVEQAKTWLAAMKFVTAEEIEEAQAEVLAGTIDEWTREQVDIEASTIASMTRDWLQHTAGCRFHAGGTCSCGLQAALDEVL